MGFDNIIGANLSIEGLARSLNDKKPVQSLIIQGKYGTGKMTLAKMYASGLLCTSDNPPCGVCNSCKKSTENNHPDIIYIDNDGKKSIGIDTVKNLVKQSLIKPNESEYKVYIIQNAQNATHQAQNALLKAIEEPKKHLVIILLCTSLSNILQTIISRCCIVNMPSLTNAQIKTALISKGFNQLESNAYSAIANGSLGKALDYATDSKFLETRDEYINLLKLVNESKTSAYMQITEKKDKLKDIISVWQSFVRDSILYSETRDISSLENSHRLPKIKEYIALHSNEKLLSQLDCLLETELRLNANVQVSLAIDYVMINL